MSFITNGVGLIRHDTEELKAMLREGTPTKDE